MNIQSISIVYINKAGETVTVSAVRRDIGVKYSVTIVKEGIILLQQKIDYDANALDAMNDTIISTLEREVARIRNNTLHAKPKKGGVRASTLKVGDKFKSTFGSDVYTVVSKVKNTVYYINSTAKDSDIYPMHSQAKVMPYETP